MLEALGRQFPQDRFVCLLPGGPSRAAGALVADNLEWRGHRLPARALAGSVAVTGRPRVDRLLGGRLDVLWAPAPRPLWLSDGVAFVLTVHDLSFLERPADFTAYERLWHRLARPGRLASRADRVVVDADCTRRAVVERWRLAASRVEVVAPGVSRPGRTPSEAEVLGMRTRRGLPARYLLAVGALEPRKAPELLVRAHARAREAGLRAELVFAGGGRLATRLRAPGVHVLGHVDHSELEALYAGARALVMPSWLEGFGLPPLEALARGVPPVVADLPVYEETLGAGALRFTAGDERDLARALMVIDRDESTRRRVLEDGGRAVAPRTWDRAAAHLHVVLTEAAKR